MPGIVAYWCWWDCRISRTRPWRRRSFAFSTDMGQTPMASLFCYYYPTYWTIKGPQQVAPRTGTLVLWHFGQSDSRDLLRSVSTKTLVKWLESPIISLLHHLFKAQGLLVSCQWIEACFQTVVKCNPWYPDRGILIYKFGTRSKKMLNEPPGREKIFQLISGPMGSH